MNRQNLVVTWKFCFAAIYNFKIFKIIENAPPIQGVQEIMRIMQFVPDTGMRQRLIHPDLLSVMTSLGSGTPFYFAPTHCCRFRVTAQRVCSQHLSSGAPITWWWPSSGLSSFTWVWIQSSGSWLGASTKMASVT